MMIFSKITYINSRLDILVLLLFVSTITLAQINEVSHLEPSMKYVLKGGMGYDLPMADLADRFGSNINFHLGIERLSASNWFISGDFTYRFGSNVKEDVLSGFRLPSGDFLAIDGFPVAGFLRERGASLSISLGKVFGFQENHLSQALK